MKRISQIAAILLVFALGIKAGIWRGERKARHEAILAGQAEYFINSQSKLEWRWKTNEPPKQPVFITKIDAVALTINGHEHIIFPSSGDRVFEHSEYCDKCRKSP